MERPTPVPRGSTGSVAIFMAVAFMTSSIFGYSLVEDFFQEEYAEYNAPSIPGTGSSIGDGTPPSPNTGESPGYAYELSWKISNVYPGWGGTTSIQLYNKGNNTIYVHSVGFQGQWNGGEERKDVAVYVSPGETKYLGLIGFSGPASKNQQVYHQYQVGVGFYVRNDQTSLGPGIEQWYNAGFVYHGDRSFTVESLTEKTPVFYTHVKNELWSRTNDLMEAHIPEVRAIADEIQDRYGQKYTVNHMAAAFDYVRRNIEYEIELPGEDHWQSPTETLEKGTGDCEDHSILLASIIENLGGTPRMNVIAGHAFLTIYIGETEADARDVWDSVEEYYDTSLLPCWMDDNGFWLVADTLGGLNIGGLPVNSAPTDSNFWEWDFTATMVVSVIPI